MASSWKLFHGLDKALLTCCSCLFPSHFQVGGPDVGDVLMWTVTALAAGFELLLVLCLLMIWLSLTRILTKMARSGMQGDRESGSRCWLVRGLVVDKTGVVLLKIKRFCWIVFFWNKKEGKISSGMTTSPLDVCCLLKFPTKIDRYQLHFPDSELLSFHHGTMVATVLPRSSAQKRRSEYIQAANPCSVPNRSWTEWEKGNG
jgi:hypothetical protein